MTLSPVNKYNVVRLLPDPTTSTNSFLPPDFNDAQMGLVHVELLVPSDQFTWPMGSRHAVVEGHLLRRIQLPSEEIFLVPDNAFLLFYEEEPE